MGIFSFLDPALDFVFGWLLNLSYFWAILILSLVLALLISLIYKYTTNQSLMKDLKMQIKEMQKEMKQLKSEPKKMMAVQKKAMETNMKYMMHSMKPMLFTFIPIIIIFGWMSSHFAYYPIMPGEDFSTTVYFKNDGGDMTLTVPEGIGLLSDATQSIKANKASWALQGDEGEYVLEYEYGGSIFTKEITITNEKTYTNPIKPIKHDKIKSINIDQNPVKILNLYVKGWRLGWIGTYIIFSIIFSLLIRKWLKIY